MKFRSAPGSLDPSAVAAAQRDNEHARFAGSGTLREQGVGLTKRAYRHAFNGVALEAVPEAVASLRALPFVEAVYLDAPVRATLDTSVPLIGARQAWTTYGVTGANVRVAIIDTGVDYTHADLGGCFGASCKVMGGYDFVNDDNDPADDFGHGTHVAGIVAANGVLKGVAPDARLLAYKVLDAGGSGWSSDIIAAIDVAANPDGDPATKDGAHIVNLSLGAWSGDPDDAVSQAVDNVVQQGVVVVAAAGNDGPDSGTITSPGTARRAITVGATNDQDTVVGFSSVGPVVWPGGALLKPDVVAPGVSICSARWDAAWAGQECSDANHVALSGTSMATPHVTGVAALLRQKRPGWTPAQIKLALRNTALDLNESPIRQGYGRVRALSALQLPHAPPLAQIQTSGRLSNAVDILGAARSGTFQRYELTIGGGLDPSAWESVYTSTQPVRNGTLAPNFDARLRPDGFYTLRLRVWDTSGMVSEDRALIEVDNVSVTAPQAYDSIRRGDLFEVTGSVQGSASFHSYTIEYGVGASPSDWYSTGISLVQGGTQPIDNGVLGTWDTSGLSAPGWYSLRVASHSGWGTHVETMAPLYLDPRLKAGWPVRVPWDLYVEESGQGLRTNASVYTLPKRTTTERAADRSGPAHVTVLTSSPEFQAQAIYTWAGTLVPVIGDIDGNGIQEIAVLKGGMPVTLHAFEASGNLRWSAPLTTDVPGGNLTKPTLADIDRDGATDIAVVVPEFSTSLRSSRLFAFRGDGSSLPGFPLNLPLDYQPAVIAADLDGDGAPELVVYGNDSNQRYISVVNRSARVVSQWTLPLRTWGSSSGAVPAVGNFDSDPALEIVIAEPSEFAGYDGNAGGWNNTGAVRVYNMDGTAVTGWPRYTQGITFGAPAIADMDRDGKEDIIVALTYSSENGTDPALGGIAIYHRDGRLHAGWPQLLGNQFTATPAIGDVNNDGRPDIAISDGSRRTWVINADGTTLPGWPTTTAWFNRQSTAISDVDGDGAADVIATAGGEPFGGGVYAWTRAGNAIPGFPLYTEVNADASATVADLDNDGKVEIIASSNFDRTESQSKKRGSLYVWDLGVRHSPNAAFWPHIHHDSAHSGRYQPLAAADLVVSAVTAPPPARNRGTKFNIEDTVRNRGFAPAKATVTRYYLSTDAVRDAADVRMVGKRAVPELLATQSWTGDVDITVPGTVRIGQYSVLACADDTLLVPESNEGNNCLAAGLISVTAPDLRQSQVGNPPASAKLGASFTIRDTTENAGNGLATASTTRYYLSLDKTKSSADVRLSGARAVPQLVPSTTSGGSTNVSVPAATQLNTYYLLTCADDLKTVKFEASEGNNCRASSGTVRIVP